MKEIRNIDDEIIKAKQKLRIKSKNFKKNFLKISKFITKEVCLIEDLQKNKKKNYTRGKI